MLSCSYTGLLLLWLKRLARASVVASSDRHIVVSNNEIIAKFIIVRSF